jgi:hypothetical protein
MTQAGWFRRKLFKPENTKPLQGYHVTGDTYCQHSSKQTLDEFVRYSSVQGCSVETVRQKED